MELKVVSSVCPDYEVNGEGRPTYRGLNNGISPNTEVHLQSIPLAVKKLGEAGVNVQHLVLLADTEVDLLPFLYKLKLSSSEFITRCQSSVDKISKRLEYPKIVAYRFLDFFGEVKFNQVFQLSYDRLIEEYKRNGNESRIVDRDYQARLPLIKTLIGDVSKEAGMQHLFRQRAQYVTFAKLMREYSGGRIIAVNHTTPNFVLMNHLLSREISVEQSARGNFLPIMPLVELNISTLPQ